MSRSKPITIAVEGNIAAGKSTLLEYLKMKENAFIIVEPVEKWQNLAPGMNILERMYSDPKRWAHLFQSYVLLTMMEAHETPVDKNLCVMERSVYSARYCFIENLRKSNPPLIDDMEYTVYQKWFDWLMIHNRPKVDLIVYLRTSPLVCMDRLKIRARHEEAGVPLSYLETLNDRYEDWLIENPSQHGGNVPVLVLDANRDTQNNQLQEEFYNAILKKLDEQNMASVSELCVEMDSLLTTSPGRPTKQDKQLISKMDTKETFQTPTRAPPLALDAHRRLIMETP